MGGDKSLRKDLQLDVDGILQALQSLEFSAGYARYFINSKKFDKLPSLKRVVIHGHNIRPPHVLHPIPLPKTLGLLAHMEKLRHLRLYGCDDQALDGLQNFPENQLETFSITPTKHAFCYDVGYDTPVGQLLLKSRGSLKELALTRFYWDFPPPEEQSSTPGHVKLIWPRVVRLHITPLRRKKPDAIALSYTFPSTRCFSLNITRPQYYYLIQPYNTQFAAGLRYFQGSWKDIAFAREAGAKLEHVTVTSLDFPIAHELGYALTDTIGSLHLNITFGTLCSQESIFAIPNLCHNLRFLGVHVSAASKDSIMANLVRIAVLLVFTRPL